MTSIQEMYCELIANSYGKEHQAKKLIEELSELIRAIVRNDAENIIEELADVEIMIYQVKTLMNLENDVKQKIDEKIDRQSCRMRDEKINCVTDCAWQTVKGE
jgi:NTP pyrophosphatase (non-canonical NTP hydrolase)